mmetsp:Transcript_59259/g.123769  ORF Transcript_59259/g.123769 Transcript_59259/m.123769 type:complete len:179 (-) Transcript_59259:289-825(-)
MCHRAIAQRPRRQQASRIAAISRSGGGGRHCAAAAARELFSSFLSEAISPSAVSAPSAFCCGCGGGDGGGSGHVGHVDADATEQGAAGIVEGLEGPVEAVRAEGVDGGVLLGGGEGTGADGAEARALAAEVDGDVDELNPAVEEREVVELAVGDGEGGDVGGRDAEFGDDLLFACMDD